MPSEVPRRVELLLEEIEREPIPEKLLALAVELQNALAERRRRFPPTKKNSEREH